MIEEEVC